MNRKKIIVLGAGLVGNAIAIDLKNDFEVCSADISEQALKKVAQHGIQTIKADLSSSETIKKLVADYDLVVGSVPGFMGFNMLKSVIEAGKDIVDISFFPENALELDALAKKHGVTAVVDCGVAPGMGNMILGYHNERMKIDSFHCMVGGLPLVREWPYQYKAVFSPIDVIEEYLRPARYRLNGDMVERPALTDVEKVHFDNIGTLESFNSDGLRSLLFTMDIPNMIEKTLRFPGSVEYLEVLRASGFFSYEEIEVKGQKIRPIDVTAKLLFPKWKLQPGEGDFTVMRITIEGTENGASQKYTYDLYDEYDKATDTISMARTTGYTCTAAVHLVASGRYNQKGICPPEYLGLEKENLDFVFQYLKDRGVIYKVS